VRRRALLTCFLTLLAAASSVVWVAVAAAEPVKFRHGTVNHRLTTSRPNAPSGFKYDARYHAAGNPTAYPPYMRKMISYNRSGLRYDTSVPKRCSASDLKLAIAGPGACPKGSRLGGGTTETAFAGRFPSSTKVDMFNNKNQQIILARSPGLATVARGRIHRDGSVEFASPTCFPSIHPVGCPVDNVLQLKASIRVEPYTRTSNGVTRSWLRTPRTCPASGYWKTPIRFWWADGSVDRVVTKQPCRRPGAGSSSDVSGGNG
jgi:hypothetical protein